MTSINLTWLNLAIALFIAFTPIGIAQVVLYSDVQTIKNNQGILFKYKSKSETSKDEAMQLLREIVTKLEYLEKEADESKEAREILIEKAAEFYYLNPQLKKPGMVKR